MTTYYNRDGTIDETVKYLINDYPVPSFGMSVERLVSSMRGRIILGTALHMAIKELEKVEGAHRQVSTLEDMRSMLESDHFINIHDDEEE